MLAFLHYLLYFAAVFSAGLSVFYSIKSKRTAEGKTRGLYRARMNISMGFMLLSFGAVQLFLYGFDSWIRVAVGFIFILIGCFNLFAGIRNHSHYSQS